MLVVYHCHRIVIKRHLLLLELYHNPNSYHFVLQVNALISEITARTCKYPCTLTKFSNFCLKISLFIWVSIPSQPNQWSAFSDTILIARMAMGSFSGQALLSQWKCNLCSANEEELPCHNSYTQHWKEDVALKETSHFDKYQTK